jgi:hypothetical protein
VMRRTVIVRVNEIWHDILRKLGRVSERRGVAILELSHGSHDSGFSKSDAQAHEGREDLEGTHCGGLRLLL